MGSSCSAQAEDEEEQWLVFEIPNFAEEIHTAERNSKHRVETDRQTTSEGVEVSLCIAPHGHGLFTGDVSVYIKIHTEGRCIREAYLKDRATPTPVFVVQRPLKSTSSPTGDPAWCSVFEARRRLEPNCAFRLELKCLH